MDTQAKLEGVRYEIKADDMRFPEALRNIPMPPEKLYISLSLVPRNTNKMLTSSKDGPNKAVFIYDAYHTPGDSNSSFTMNFVEAGTESDRNPAFVRSVKKSITVDEDQAVMTPDADTVAALNADGQEPDGSYIPVMHCINLKWLDDDGMPVEEARAIGKNPTLYTVKDWGFALKTPDNPDPKIPDDPVRPSEPTNPDDPIALKEQTSYPAIWAVQGFEPHSGR